MADYIAKAAYQAKQAEIKEKRDAWRKAMAAPENNKYLDMPEAMFREITGSRAWHIPAIPKHDPWTNNKTLLLLEE